MSTETSHLPAAAGAALAADQAEANKRKLLEGLATEELLKSTCRLSERLGRSFLGRTNYDGEKALDAALAEARRALPEVPSAYKPTGKTTVAATLLMLLAAPAVLLLLLAVCGGLCLGWAYLESLASSDHSYNQSRLFGLGSIAVDLVLVVLMVVIPTFCFGVLSKWFKNRNPKLPAVVTGIIDFLVAIVLFIPIWKGETLAPTHLTFLFIPIRWVLIVIGGLLVPLAGVAAVHDKLSRQKFCEQTGRYLRRMRRVKLPFDWGENALALLQRGEFVRAVRLPKAGPEELKQKHWAEISLWWHEQAATAFLEMEMRFHGQSKPQKALTVEKSQDKTKDWLVFSAQLDQLQAGTLADEIAPGV